MHNTHTHTHTTTGRLPAPHWQPAVGWPGSTTAGQRGGGGQEQQHFRRFCFWI